jgi:formylglycine-generating enzyme required for sulfatase activity
MNPAHRECPYVGLVPFSVADWPFFFGRDSARQIVTANLQAARLTLLYGPSGVGKSSILRAGVQHHLEQQAKQDLDELRDPESVVVTFSSWADDPLASLNATIRDAIASMWPNRRDLIDRTSQSLVDVLCDWTERTGADLLMILDQFEEYFEYHGNEDGVGTLPFELAQAINKRDLRANFLLSIREDSLAKLDCFKGRITNLFDNYLRIDHLEREAARQAIELPLRKHTEQFCEAMDIEPELVDDVLDDVRIGRTWIGRRGQGGLDTGNAQSEPVQRIETAFLQLVMTRLWQEERRLGSLRLRRETYRTLGRAETIVRTHLDRATSGLARSERSLAARIFDRLVTPSGTKFAMSAEDLARKARVPTEHISRILDKLSASEARILRPIAPQPDSPHMPRYEIFHDVLAPAVLDWLGRQQQQDESRSRMRWWFRWISIFLLFVVGASIPYISWWSRSQNQWTDTLVRALLAAPPENVPYAIEGLRPFRHRAASRLVQLLNEEPSGSRAHLLAAMALADFGELRLEPLCDAISDGVPGQCPNIVRALRAMPEDALLKISRHLERGQTVQQRIRLAAVSLHLGDIPMAAEFTTLAEDPTNRAAFIHYYAEWPGDPSELAAILCRIRQDRNLDNLRSAIVAALGHVAWDALLDEQRNMLRNTILELYRKAPDGGTRSAAYWTLKKWGLSVPSDAEPNFPVSSDWYVAHGMTMIRIPAEVVRRSDSNSMFPEKAMYFFRPTREFFLADREVTVALFNEFVKASSATEYPADERPDDWQGIDSRIAPTDECPVHNVSWDDAVKFCNWLSRREGLIPCYRRTIKKPVSQPHAGDWECDFAGDGYRLPTESEWEYACRAMSQSRYPFGGDDDLLTEYAWFYSNARERTYPAGEKLPNGWGLFDMQGNLWEWVWDRHVTDEREQYSVIASVPTGPETLERRSVCGGGWFFPAEACAPVMRRGNYPGYRSNVIGFRVARGQPN